MKIGLYIHDILFKTGGTEANTAYIINSLQNLFANPEITVFSEKYHKKQKIANIAEHLNNNFKTTINSDNLNLTQFTSGKNILARFFFYTKMHKASKIFDVFFNCSLNMYTFKSKFNIFIAHFPPYRKIHSGLVKSFPLLYHFANNRDKLFSSKYNLYITYSQFVFSWLNKIWNINSDRTACINPAVSLIKKSFENKKNYIIICSRIEKSKEIDVLISAFLKSDIIMQNMKLFIIGAVIKDNIEYTNKIQSMISEYPDSVSLIKNPSREKIEEMYSLSKIFWHAKGYSFDENTDPMAFEHFGLTTVEAMSAGCVPVVINKGGQREIVDEGINGFRWDTPDELIQKTLFLIQNENERVRMSQAAFDKSQNYSFDAFTNNLGIILKRDHE